MHHWERAEITAKEKVQQILEIAYTARKVSVQKGDSCSMKRDPAKRPQSKGRLSTHHRPPGFQNDNKGDGKGKAPRISGTTPSGKKDEPHASSSKEGHDRMVRLVITGTLPSCANFNTSQDCKYGGKCIYTNRKKGRKILE